MHANRKGAFRVMAQNLWGRYGAWPERREVLRDGLRRADPHLAAFVEPVRADDYVQITDLLGPGYEVVHQSKADGDVVGVALASRWPVEAVHELDLRVSDRMADSLDVSLAAEIVAPEPI